MAQKSYVFTQDYKAPYVTATGQPHNPQKIGFKRFQRGEIVKGELKHANNKPAFVLVHGVCVVPLAVIKEVVTKAVVSHTDGTQSTIDESKPKKKTINTNPKVRYIDAAIMGALVGVVGVYVAEKQGWIAEPDKKNKIYGAAIGALAGLYVIYRLKTSKKVIKPGETEE